MPLPTAEERIGTLIDGKYRLDRILGEGGFGVVYAGTHLRLERPVAVKFLHPQYATNDEVVHRFVREAQATSRLSHPNVVDVRDVDTAPDGSVYMVLELLEGESLQDYLASRGQLSIDETLSIIRPVIDALEAAHRVGIVHRDIKPDNVFLSRGPDGQIIPKVLDFGIAKLVDGSSKSTATGSVFGTPVYMAPEQAMGQQANIGPWSDVWSMAVMLYECLTGRYPYEIPPDPAPTTVLLAVVSGVIIPLAHARGELLPAYSDILSRALDRSVETRIRSMAELGRALDDVRAGTASESTRRARVSAKTEPDPTLGEEARGPAGRTTRPIGEMPTTAKLGASTPYGGPDARAHPTGGVSPTEYRLPAAPRRRLLALGGIALVVALVTAAAVVGTQAGEGQDTPARPQPDDSTSSSPATPPPPTASGPVAPVVAAEPMGAVDAGAVAASESPNAAPIPEPSPTPSADARSKALPAARTRPRRAQGSEEVAVPRPVSAAPSDPAPSSSSSVMAPAPPRSESPPMAPTPSHRSGAVSLDQF